MVSPLRRLARVVDAHPLLGAVVWQASVQYFVVQVVVALAWAMPYSWRLNAISDLGAVGCGAFNGRAVCSPLHGLMNASFVLLGLIMIVGSVLLYRVFRRTPTGFALMAAAGLGAVIVGLFPEDTIRGVHIAGAALVFVLGNAALIVFGARLPLPRWFRIVSVAAGVVALVALVLFLTGTFLGLGLGGMERVVAYPQTVWLIAFGIHVADGDRRRALIL